MGFYFFLLFSMIFDMLSFLSTDARLGFFSKRMTKVSVEGFLT